MSNCERLHLNNWVERPNIEAVLLGNQWHEVESGTFYPSRLLAISERDEDGGDLVVQIPDGFEFNHVESGRTVIGPMSAIQAWRVGP